MNDGRTVDDKSGSSSEESAGLRPANYSTDEELDEKLPEENHAPTQGPLGEWQHRRDDTRD